MPQPGNLPRRPDGAGRRLRPQRPPANLPGGATERLRSAERAAPILARSPHITSALFGPIVRTPAITKEAFHGIPLRACAPPRADLAQQKSLAREFLEAFHAPSSEAHATAQACVRAVLPDKSRVVLADCQFVIAREYEFHDWAAIKQHIKALRLAARGPHAPLHDAMARRDAASVRRLLQAHAQFRPETTRGTLLAEYHGRPMRSYSISVLREGDFFSNYCYDDG